MAGVAGVPRRTRSSRDVTPAPRDRSPAARAWQPLCASAFHVILNSGEGSGVGQGPAPPPDVERPGTPGASFGEGASTQAGVHAREQAKDDSTPPVLQRHFNYRDASVGLGFLPQHPRPRGCFYVFSCLGWPIWTGIHAHFFRCAVLPESSLLPATPNRRSS